MKVYQAINAVQAALSEQGIAKNKRNTQGAGYNFRGIDDVYNALAPELASNGLVVIPRTVTRESVERVSKQGGALFYVVVDMEFDFVSSEDGSKHTARTFGEAMDSGDKATNKAMSAAFKYAMFQTFCIPTEAQDADAETHEVAVPVTEEQIAALQDRMESNGTDKVKFFEMLGVSKLSDIKTQKQYAQAIAAQDKKDALLKAKTEAA
jgi:hypothetical protein